MSRCRHCDRDLSRVNVRYHYSRNHDDRPTYEELHDEVLALEEIIASRRDRDEQVWKILWAYHADDKKRVARDDDGMTNVYNTLLLILFDLFPERTRELFDDMERAGR